VAASTQGRLALGPRAGQLLRRLRSAASAQTIAPRRARLEGFSLHADVAVPAPQRDWLERLCGYVLRPPLALERLTESSGGQLLYQFRRPWSDDSTALLLEPLELLERLAALVPAPRRPLLAYHGVLAPRARWRPQVVGYGRPAPTVTTGDPAAAHRVPPPARRNWTWAALMRRAFAVDVLACPRCGGRLRVIATVEDPVAVRQLLAAPRPP
jgi:Putative transposase